APAGQSPAPPATAYARASAGHPSWSAVVSYEAVPGLVEGKEAHDETTLVVDGARLVEACSYLRDEEGFNFLSDVSATDYLGWGSHGVAGYIGTPGTLGPLGGRSINHPGSQGLQKRPEAKPKRFSVSYHLLKLASGAR